MRPRPRSDAEAGQGDRHADVGCRCQDMPCRSALASKGGERLRFRHGWACCCPIGRFRESRGLDRRMLIFVVPTRMAEKAAAGVATARSQNLAPSRCRPTKPSPVGAQMVQASYAMTSRLPHFRHLRVRVLRYDLSTALMASVSALPSSSRSAASRRRLVQTAASGRPAT